MTKIISKRGKPAPPPVQDGNWPFPTHVEPLTADDLEVLDYTTSGIVDINFVDFEEVDWPIQGCSTPV